MLYNEITIINLEVKTYPEEACSHKTHKADVVLLPHTVIQPLRQKIVLDILVKMLKFDNKTKF